MENCKGILEELCLLVTFLTSHREKQLIFGRTIRQDLTLTYVPGETNAVDRIGLYYSNTDQQQPYNDSSGVELVGHTTADFTALYQSKPDRFKPKWRIQKGMKKVRMYLLEYQVEILMDSESGVLKFRVLAKGNGDEVLVQEKDIEYALVA